MNKQNIQKEKKIDAGAKELPPPLEIIQPCSMVLFLNVFRF